MTFTITMKTNSDLGETLVTVDSDADIELAGIGPLTNLYLHVSGSRSCFYTVTRKSEGNKYEETAKEIDPMSALIFIRRETEDIDPVAG